MYALKDGEYRKVERIRSNFLQMGTTWDQIVTNRPCIQRPRCRKLDCKRLNQEGYA